MNVEIIEAPSIPLPSAIDGDVVVLPREVSDNGIGLYDDSVITIVKELQLLGVEASFQHKPDSRSWIGEKSVAKIVIDLVVGIGSSAGWAALCRLLGGQHKNDHVRVRAGRFRQHQGTTSSEWYEIEGTGDAVARAMAQIEARSGSSEEDEQKALEDYDYSRAGWRHPSRFTRRSGGRYGCRQRCRPTAGLHRRTRAELSRHRAAKVSLGAKAATAFAKERRGRGAGSNR